MPNVVWLRRKIDDFGLMFTNSNIETTGIIFEMIPFGDDRDRDTILCIIRVGQRSLRTLFRISNNYPGLCRLETSVPNNRSVFHYRELNGWSKVQWLGIINNI